MKTPMISDIEKGVLLILAISIFSSCAETSKNPDQIFNLKRIAGGNSDISQISDGRGFEGKVLKVIPSGENTSVTIWKTGDNGDWTDANYFVFEIFGDNGYSGVITLEFYKKGVRASEKADYERIPVSRGRQRLLFLYHNNGKKIC